MSAIGKISMKFISGMPVSQVSVTNSEWLSVLAEIEALHQEWDCLLADAARYRWLRSNNVGPSQIEKVSDDCNPPYFTLKCEGELDTAIDAAMAKEQGDGA